MGIRTTGVAALALLPLAALAGCNGSTKDALAFNQAIVNANQKLASAGQELGQAIGRAAAGGPAEIAQAKQLYDQTKQVMQQVKADIQAVHVPSSSTAQALHDADQKFLQGQERIIEKDFAEVIKLLEDTKMDKGERAQKLAAIFSKVGNTEQTDLASLRTAQRDFAKEYNLTLQ
jgi:aromatic ring hydroxylase